MYDVNPVFHRDVYLSKSDIENSKDIFFFNVTFSLPAKESLFLQSLGNETSRDIKEMLDNDYEKAMAVAGGIAAKLIR